MKFMSGADSIVQRGEEWVSSNGRRATYGRAGTGTTKKEIDNATPASQ
jgi:hypothetical protein